MSNKKEVEKDSLTDLFNVDMDRFKEIGIMFYDRSGVKGSKWVDIVNETKEKAKVTGESESLLLGYLFGRAYQAYQLALEQREASDEVRRLAAMLEKAMLENKKGKKTS